MLREAMLRGSARPGRSEVIAVGVTIDAGKNPPLAMTPEWFECRFEARIADAAIEALTPCDGFRGYLFPNHARAIVAEDVSPVLQVSIGPADR
jgi:hypothetical protein